MKIGELLAHVRMHDVEISPEQEKILVSTFGTCPTIECLIHADKGFIENSITMEKQCYILHSDGSMDKKIPNDDEKIYFGIFISSLGESSYLIAIPKS